MSMPMWVSIPAMLISIVALVRLIAGVVSLIKTSHLFRVPLRERQNVEFPEPGPVVLSVEGPRLTRRFAEVGFELSGVNGDPVEGHRAWFRARTSGISTARMELMKYDIPRAGRYVLRMSGLGEPRASDGEHSVVLTRPHLARSMLYVLGIVAASGLFIVSLVFTLLSVVGTEA